MYKPVQQCTNCGAGLKLDDMRGDNCPYCNTVFPHKSVAAQHQQMMGNMMGNMMAQQNAVQNQWRGAFGAPPVGMPPPPGMHGSPYADPNKVAQVHMAHVSNMSKSIMWIVFGSMIFVFVLVAVIMAVVFLSI